MATGLAVSAAGIGSAVFAPVTEYLIRRFGWRVAMQVVALTLFISGLFALSFKDLEYDDTSTDYDEEDTSVYDELSKQKIVKFNEKDDLCAEEEKLMKNDNLGTIQLMNCLVDSYACAIPLKFIGVLMNSYEFSENFLNCLTRLLIS